MTHIWILECLKLYKRALIRISVGIWQTTLEANVKPIAQVTIKCGIYQGHALFQLLLRIGLNPFSEITGKTGYRYQL